MIDPAAEAEAIADWKAGDILAGDRLLRMHAGLIYSIVRRYVTDRCEIDDLLQVGRLALLDAATEHDAAKGRPSTFATRKIRGRCRWLMLSAQRATEPNAHAMSFDAPLGDWGGTLHDIVAAPDLEEPSGVDVDALFGSLTPVQQDAIRGFYGPESQTLEEIGAARGVTKEAVRVAKDRALEHLRAALIKNAQPNPRSHRVKRNAAMAATRAAHGVAALGCGMCKGEYPHRHNRRTCPLRQAA